ncbi:MAG: hypothetical protein WD489_09295 [Rhodovibrionaceae bacterium]
MGSLFSPDEPELPDDEEEKEKAKRAAEARRRRGLASTVLTSGRGVLTPLGAASPARKTLLGE